MKNEKYIGVCHCKWSKDGIDIVKIDPSCPWHGVEIIKKEVMKPNVFNLFALITLSVAIGFVLGVGYCIKYDKTHYRPDGFRNYAEGIPELMDDYWKTNKALSQATNADWLETNSMYRNVSIASNSSILSSTCPSNTLTIEEAIRNYDNYCKTHPSFEVHEYAERQRKLLYDQYSTEWVGHPMVSDNDPYTPSEGWLKNVEIGLREDGVVVWKTVTNYCTTNIIAASTWSSFSNTVSWSSNLWVSNKVEVIPVITNKSKK